ncbi:MAG: hypothetical protein KDK12_17140 [Rhodobacteraceae bacterium]|nr:hypothetical protein [Paracoccaceae bacterium]
MRAALSADAALFLTPLVLLVLAFSPAMAPIRRAFLERPSTGALQPGESVLAEVRPDRQVLGTLALSVLGATVAAALAGQWVLGAAPLVSYLPLAPFATAALVRLSICARCRWLVTDRRVITELGASLPLADIGRIAVAPARLQLDGQGTQSLRLTGLADAAATARMIRAHLARNR